MNGQARQPATARPDFVILDQQVDGRPLVYLDNAASTQKPECVINAVASYYRTSHANVHRAAHVLAARATEQFERARQIVARHINARETAEIIWTRGTTEAINLVAHGLTLAPGDEILITAMEHHSNIVPWQMLAKRCGASVRAIDVTPAGELDLSTLDELLTPRTRLLAVGHVSNALGTIHPLATLIDAAHAAGADVLIDGAQAVAHLGVDVQALDVEYYAFSGHKVYGPTGIGVLYGKRDRLERLQPFQTGGEMIERVTLGESTFNRLPYRFEAGTPNIAGAIGLGAALEYLAQFDSTAVQAHEERLVQLAISGLQQIPGTRLVGDAANRTSVVSFLHDAGHPEDFGTLLDAQGVAVRTGHHCAMPLMDALCVPGTIRASFSLYNSESDVAALITAVDKAVTFL